MMRSDIWMDSIGGGKLHAIRWSPEGEIRAVVQIIHGIAEFAQRYDHFAGFLNEQGILVVAEDHMGHGQSISEQAPQGYFSGGWMAAVKDSCRLMHKTMEAYPGVPYFLFGHSMGSFMTRTILEKYPDSGISGAVICGTGWLPDVALTLGKTICNLTCKRLGEQSPSATLNQIVFGSYNRKVEHPRTAYDWLTRDSRVVDAYIAHPLCGFVPSCGLLRDMMEGILYIQDEQNLRQMKKDLPVFFIAGGDDPVGNYGAGVRKAVAAFQKQGMEHVQVHLYPMCRHEILNEINKEEIYQDVLEWMNQIL